MALFIRQSEDRSQLQERLAAELQEKARKKAQETTSPDGVTDSAYLKDTKSTTSLAWVWVLLVIITVGVVIFVIISTSR